MSYAEIAEPSSPVTHEQMVARAEAIAPTLVERQAETEERNYYAEDTHRAFREAGFYRMLTPKRYGGLEVSIDTFLSVATAIGRGCGSTGWMLCLGTSHGLTMGSFFDEQAQSEAFAETDFICPTTVRPQGEATPTDGGYTINGDFNFCSGSPYGMYYMGHTFPPDAKAPMLFVAPRSEWTRLDDWGTQIGLKGSGSHSIRFENGFVPEHMTKRDTGLMSLDPSDGTPGLELHGNPMYAGSSYSFFMLEAAAMAVGIAKGALDAFGEGMATRMTAIPPPRPRKEDPDYQRWYGTAAGIIATAEAARHNCAEQWTRLAEQGAFTKENDMELVTISKEIVKMCWRAVQESLARPAGSTAMRTGECIERSFRDLATIHAHNGIVAFGETATRELAKARFGVE